jgi:hypothetical protein
MTNRDWILMIKFSYLLVCSALDALVGQLEQAERDLLRLQEMKQRALEDPASYTLSLARGVSKQVSLIICVDLTNGNDIDQ